MEQTIVGETQLSWRGFHHIALATTNLDATIHFYKDVLGMQVSEIAPPKQGRGRHCLMLVKPGDDEVLGFHFFESQEVKSSGPRRLGDGYTGEALLHIALRLPNETAAHTLRQRLYDAQVFITDIPELGTFVFSDNNGILLEATWPQQVVLGSK
jgi:catechol 2,3-dioxygenase-like lactoylglutathione lyase family enzyme